ncbi:sugar phosphate isomerase/epimerase family protein [Halorubrum lacusprofundi]|jgi:sugar phosphate isomerase/epimerase|uniref:Xylose isomerase domain protein TIM barrel n=1 Tax=Halorubrum lacusprofundi (strain ATCC 49239 / DSM 5036 / JCM 8891 / ACAM 34) TaxID=416348 RepID=B9LR33_HALLT|nr:sugar phosphate isomerase/epimerase [Halorubrum lacusprofundi]ACM57687.1 Xylose isomerase domain protein TIM barrel [Halorubrum lacusprofundi ATCC 49239]MCG1005717.1 sugar phosphate isomerase/epimerase [Halorubrum lacusprofundi]
MDIGLTVGDDLDRLAASPKRFDFCELGVGEPTLVPGDIDPERLDDALAGRDLLVHLPYSQRLASYVPEVNDAIVDYQRRLLEAAGELGAEKAVLHATSADRDDTEFREVAAEQLRRVADAGRDAGVEVVVENVGHQHAGLQLSVLGDIARETDTRICFDLGHAYMEGDNKAIKRFLRSHGGRISHLHCHDARRRGDTHLPVGAGEVDYGHVESELGDFDGTVALEVFTDDETLLLDSARRIAERLGVDF